MINKGCLFYLFYQTELKHTCLDVMGAKHVVKYMQGLTSESAAFCCSRKFPYPTHGGCLDLELSSSLSHIHTDLDIQTKNQTFYWSRMSSASKTKADLMQITFNTELKTACSFALESGAGKPGVSLSFEVGGGTYKRVAGQKITLEVNFFMFSLKVGRY